MNALGKLRHTATRYFNSLHDAARDHGGDGEPTRLILAELLSREGLCPIERCHQAVIAEARANGEFAIIAPMSERVLLAHRAFVYDVNAERGWQESFVRYGRAICDLDRYLPAELTGGEVAETVEATGTIAAPTSPDGEPLSDPDSPQQWAKRLRLPGGSRQFVAKFTARKLTGEKIHTKSYRLYLRYLPAEDMESQPRGPAERHN